MPIGANQLEYLNKHKIPHLFNGMVEDLAKYKPDKVLPFLANFLKAYKQTTDNLREEKVSLNARPQLRVIVVSASNLPAAEPCDPYIRLRLGRFTSQTSTKVKSTNPNWDDVFMMDADDVDTQQLNIEVWGAMRGVAKLPIGKASVQLRQLPKAKPVFVKCVLNTYHKGLKEWWMDPDNMSTVTLKITAIGFGMYYCPVNAQKLLRVYLRNAFGVPNSLHEKNPSPLMRFRNGTIVVQSSQQKNTSTPVFNETLLVDVNDKSPEALTVELWSQNRATAKAPSAVSAPLPLSTLPFGQLRPFLLPLEVAGRSPSTTLKVGVTCFGFGLHPSFTRAAQMVLRINLIRCTGIPGDCAPYIRFRLGGCTSQSSSKPNRQGTIEWNESFVMNVTDQISLLTVEVWTEERGKVESPQYIASLNPADLPRDAGPVVKLPLSPVGKPGKGAPPRLELVLHAVGFGAAPNQCQLADIQRIDSEGGLVSSILNIPQRVLRIRVIEARNLLPSQPNPTCDPWVRVSLGKQKGQSAQAKDTVDPHWDSTLLFDVDKTDQPIEFAIWSKLRTETSSPIAQLVLPLTSLPLVQQETIVTLPMSRKEMDVDDSFTPACGVVADLYPRYFGANA